MVSLGPRRSVGNFPRPRQSQTAQKAPKVKPKKRSRTGSEGFSESDQLADDYDDAYDASLQFTASSTLFEEKAKPRQRQAQGSNRPANHNDFRYDVIEGVERPPMTHDRYEDLRLGRPLREGEIVWMPIQPPIICPRNPDIVIDHWPTIVESARFGKQVWMNRSEGNSEVPYHVEEGLHYNLRPFATGASKFVLIHAKYLIPYCAYRTSQALVDELRNSPSPPSQYHDDISKFFKEYAPFLPEDGSGSEPQDIAFDDVAPQYAIALQVVTNAATRWCPVQEVPNVPGQDTHYQGVWWGPEKIWVGDVIRLNVTRDELQTHPVVAKDILPRNVAWKSGDEPSTRGMLMQITSIFTTEIVPPPDSPAAVLDSPTMPVCRLSGRVFETWPEAYYEGSGQESEWHKFNSASSSNTPSAISSPSLSSPMVTKRNLPSLPPPPPGYRFHPVLLDQRSDLVLDVSMISGRYYPNLLLTPRIDLERLIETNNLGIWRMVLSLAGLAEGRFASTYPQTLCKDRMTAVQESDGSGKTEITHYWKNPVNYK